MIRADEGPDATEQRGVEWAARHRQVTGDVLDDKPALLITATRLGRGGGGPFQGFSRRHRPVAVEQTWNTGGVSVERVTGIEPALSAWEADVLPLNYTRRRRAPPIMAHAGHGGGR